jgi:triosephosphate isomerase
MRRMFVAGNWKMNLDLNGAVALAAALKEQVGGVEEIMVGVCPPFVYCKAVADAVAGSAIVVGGQNMCTEPEGAFTGEISGAMLRDVGCTHVILGHSERRHVFGEPDALVNEKALKALADGLKPILCVGEKLDEREAGRTEVVVTRQIMAGLAGVSVKQMPSVTVAYEPVWAIGTGRTATPDQAQEVHALIRGLVARLYSDVVAADLTIQYGGSVKPDNADDLLCMPDVDGALVGGASLTAEKFVPIVQAGVRASSGA